jgi:hypothetical protein
MLQDGANLLDGDAREPLNELRYECAVFEVLEKGRDRHSGAAKYPGATHALGIALNGQTSRPVNHRLHGTTGAEETANAGANRGPNSGPEPAVWDSGSARCWTSPSLNDLVCTQ